MHDDENGYGATRLIEAGALVALLVSFLVVLAQPCGVGQCEAWRVNTEMQRGK